MNHNKSFLNRQTCSAALAIAVAVASAQALAENANDGIDPMTQKMFTSGDADKSGSLSFYEFYDLNVAAALMQYEASFKQLDTDGSGQLEKAEFLGHLPKTADQLALDIFKSAAGTADTVDMNAFSKMRMSTQQLSANLIWDFASIDVNGNSELSLAEYSGQVDPTESPTANKNTSSPSNSSVTTDDTPTKGATPPPPSPEGPRDANPLTLGQKLGFAQRRVNLYNGRQYFAKQDLKAAQDRLKKAKAAETPDLTLVEALNAKITKLEKRIMEAKMKEQAAMNRVAALKQKIMDNK